VTYSSTIGPKGLVREQIRSARARLLAPTAVTVRHGEQEVARFTGFVA